MDNIKIFFKKHNYAFRYKLLWCLPILIFLIALDWISKAIVVSKMEYSSDPVSGVPGLLRFRYLLNPGAALSMNAGKPFVAILLATLVTVFLMALWLFLNQKLWLQPINFMLSGSIANVVGRIWAPVIPDGFPSAGTKGGVVDFLEWDFNFLGSQSYTFNLADVYVNISIAVLIIAFIIFSWGEIKAYIYKKQDVFYEEFLEFRDSLAILENSYLESVRKKSIKNQFSLYKNYLQNKKTLKRNWIEQKKLLTQSKLKVLDKTQKDNDKAKDS
ncbi:lipoprotein signal peptidase [Spiroplasma helicoides]|uniref:Lipoprotein signal peptidase n=1 Tax=Spiroplasma helicoides TaxID=216938 RepID=A0A1B3SL51_9MOLU|nr:signal peptidase II [Spiroplasma helicoides]AOG60655.1 lipoprotein signal peptidase [Spiroplasma helicoides]